MGQRGRWQFAKQASEPAFLRSERPFHKNNHLKIMIFKYKSLTHSYLKKNFEISY